MTNNMMIRHRGRKLG